MTLGAVKPDFVHTVSSLQVVVAAGVGPERDATGGGNAVPGQIFLQ